MSKKAALATVLLVLVAAVNWWVLTEEAPPVAPVGDPEQAETRPPSPAPDVAPVERQPRQLAPPAGGDLGADRHESATADESGGDAAERTRIVAIRPK